LSDEEESKSPVLKVKDGGFPREEVLKQFRGTLFDTKSNNFLGSGMPFNEWYMMMDVLRYDRWHGTQTREEKRRRMKYLIALCAEQARLVKESIQATGISEMLIEDLIAGDWRGVLTCIGMLKFEEERGVFRESQAKRFARFVEIAQETYDTRPKVFCPVCVQPTPKDHIGAFHDGRHICPWCEIVHDDEGNHEDKAKANLKPVKEPASD
jgi:hypothetical protein